MARAGRKRRSNVARHPNGRIKYGTVRLEAVENVAVVRARRALVGADGDMTKGECPLGVLVARGIVNRETEAALAWFRRLARFALGSPSTRGALDDGIRAGDEMSEALAELLADQWRWVRTRLRGAGYDAAIEVLHQQRFPRWLVAGGVADDELREREVFFVAVEVILERWKAWSSRGRRMRPA